MSNLQIAKFCRSSPKETRTFIDCCLFSPPLWQKEFLGDFFILIQIKISKNLDFKTGLFQAQKLSEIIINGLKTNYYQPEYYQKSEGLEGIFEEILQKINRLLYQEIISHHQLKEIAKNLKAFVGLVKENKVYFTATNHPIAFLIRKAKIINLISEEKTFFLPARIFSQIISGEIENNDLLFFSSDNFLDYFSKEDLRQMIKFSSDEIIEKFQNKLDHLKNQISCGIFVLKRIPEKTSQEIITPVEVLEEKFSVPVKLQPDLEETKKILIKEKEKIIAQTEKEKLPAVKKSGLFKIPAITLPSINFHFLLKFILKVGDFLNKIFSYAVKIFTFRKPVLKNVFSLNKTKILGIISLLLFIFFIQSLFIIKTQKKREMENEKFFLTLLPWQEKNVLLKIAIDSQSEKLAESTIAEWEKNFSSLLVLVKNNWQKEMVAKVKESFENQKDRFYKINRLKNLKIIADFLLIDKESKINTLSKMENSLLIFDHQNRNFYQLNLKNNQPSLLIKNFASPVNFATYRPREVILYHQSKIYCLDLDKKNIYPLKLETIRENLIVKDLKFYDKKLYLLVPAHHQIFKYRQIADNFIGEKKWLKEKTDLESSISLAIDGSIYILKENGEVLKFYLGKKQNFNLENIVPKITQPTKIITEINFKNIYLLEPVNKRVIIFNKEGKLVKQIVSPNFIYPKDFVVEEKETKIWLLDENKIIEIEL